MEKFSKNLNVESSDQVDTSRRGVLRMLAAATAVSALEFRASAETSGSSFRDWRSEMMSSDRAKYLEYEDIHLGQQEALTYRPRGVAHVADTLLQKFDAIREDINESDAVMLEYFDSRMLENQHHEQTAATIAASEGDLRNNVENTVYVHRDEWSECFFGAVAGIAAREGKDIIVVNPQTDESRELTTNNRSNFFITGGLLTGIGVVGVAHLLETKKTIEQTGDSEQPEISRRNFIKGSLAAALGIGATYMTGKNAYLERQEGQWKQIRSDELVEIETALESMDNHGLFYPSDTLEVKLEKLTHCQEDWRDAVTACSILQMTEAAEASGNTETLVHFEGAMHHGVQQYLEEPKLAQERVAFYEDTFNQTGTMSIRRFRYDATKETFELVEETPLQYQ